MCSPECMKNWIPAGVYPWFIQGQEWQENKRARIEIICRGGPMCPPVLLKRPYVPARTQKINNQEDINNQQTATGNQQMKQIPLKSPFVKRGKEDKWLPLFQSAVMNEVNFTAEKRGKGRFELHCRLLIADWIKQKTSSNKQSTIEINQKIRQFSKLDN